MANLPQFMPEGAPGSALQMGIQAGNAQQSWMDQATNRLRTQAETGLTMQQAATLARNSSPRMRDRALLVERQCAELGDFALKMLQAKDAEVFKASKLEFMLNQLPDDAKVTVDSHTSSPVYQEDSERKAFALHKAGAIDAEDLIMLTHPMHEDTLRARAKQRAEAQAALVKAHPELAFGKGKGKK